MFESSRVQAIYSAFWSASSEGSSAWWRNIVNMVNDPAPELVRGPEGAI